MNKPFKASMTKQEALGLLAGTHVRLSDGTVVVKQVRVEIAPRRLNNHGF